PLVKRAERRGGGAAAERASPPPSTGTRVNACQSPGALEIERSCAYPVLVTSHGMVAAAAGSLPPARRNAPQCSVTSHRLHNAGWHHGVQAFPGWGKLVAW